jgi:hypothetical protein
MQIRRFPGQKIPEIWRRSKKQAIISYNTTNYKIAGDLREKGVQK